MATKQQEMAKLWDQMKVVSAGKPPTGADDVGRLAFFKSQKKEMAQLKDAYTKLSGLSGDPHNKDEQDAIGRKKLLGGISGNAQPGEHPTADNL